MSNGITFKYDCPQCHRSTEIGIGSQCNNVLGDGRVCGYRLPEIFGDFNGKVREKIEKHTTAPLSPFSGELSFNPDTGFYLDSLKDARKSGTVYLDQSQGYFFTYISGDGAIAVLQTGLSGQAVDVSGFKMPVNSRLQNLHGHYANLTTGDLFVALPENVTIEEPCPSHPNQYQIIQSGVVVAAWDRAAETGFAGKHIIL